MLHGTVAKVQNKQNKNYLHYYVDIKGSSLKYRIIQYKEPINYGKEHKESTRLQETKYILQIHLLFFFSPHTIDCTVSIEGCCFRSGRLRKNCIHECLENPVTEQRK